MIFETLYESSQRGELMLVDGGMCHWHLRRDGQLTIREIISTRPGAGGQMLRRLEYTPGAQSLFAKCPAGLAANAWYSERGFSVERLEITRTGRRLICWRKKLNNIRRCPNAGNVEIIFCANGNVNAARIAIDSGMLYGAQLPGTVYYSPYFVDQDWSNPDRERYMAALAEYQPHMATVLDLERWTQRAEVVSWAEEAAQYVQRVIIIPKTRGIIAQLPHALNGAQVRLGYSVPTRYGGTTVPLSEFAQWGGDGVHLLGGSPEKQMSIYQQLPNVRSVDTNYMAAMAIRYGQFWANVQWSHTAYWPKLSEADGVTHPQPMYEALRRSCVNIMRAWNEISHQPRVAMSHATQLALWHPKYVEECNEK